MTDTPSGPLPAGTLEARGKYHIVRPLKVGGTASIYLAVMRGENAFSREVVIKRPLPHLVADARARLMFIDEAHIAARLQHPNICQVLDLVSRDDELYLVLEYLRGVDLREVVKDCIARQVFMPAELAVWMGVEVAAGLHFSHEAKGLDGAPLELVHRDVSPKNIRVTYEGSVKLIDFGIARAANRATETAAGMIKGTLGYMSPEQILGDAIDRRSDVFAFGICLFQMLTCRNPFDGANLTERVKRLTTDPIPGVRKFNPSLDEEIEAIVARALARDVDARYPTMAEVQRDLERYLGRLGVVSPRQVLVRYLDTHFATREDQDFGLASALTAASQTLVPIDPTVRLIFPDDLSQPRDSNAPLRTAPTFTPPPSEQRTEAEVAGETRHLPPELSPKAGRGPWGALLALVGVAALAVAGAVFVRSLSPSRVEVAPLRTATASVAAVSAPDAGAQPAPPPKSADGGQASGPRRDAVTKVRRRSPQLGASAEGRERARLYFLAARQRERAGALADAQLLYVLAYLASDGRPPASVYLNLGLVSRRLEQLPKAKACFRAYLSRRPDGPDASRIRTVVAALPDATRRCVSEKDTRLARRRRARSGAAIEGWIDQALKAQLR